MKYLKHNQYFFALSLICLIALFSCRKKDERYEGYYVGAERHTILDSGATTYSLDTSYHQEVEVTYSKKNYTFLRMFNNSGSETFTLDKNSFVDNEYIGEASYLKFSGDSMYLSFSNFSDYAEDWNTETWEFKGKRN